jgi:hypothetical protein
MPVRLVSFDSFVRLVRANPDYRPILIVDDVQTVTDLRALMNAAKLYADMRIMKIVLVISPGEVARRMLDYSSNSRAEVRTVDSCFSVQAPCHFAHVFTLSRLFASLTNIHLRISIAFFEQFLPFAGLPNSVVERILLQRGFAVEMAKLLAVKLGPILPRILHVPLTDPLSYAHRELFSDVSTIERCLAFNAGVGTVVERAFEFCCNAFQLCLISGNVLFYFPRLQEVRFASSLSKEAFNLVAQNVSLPLRSVV